MGTHYLSHIIRMIKGLNHITAKKITSSSWRKRPSIIFYFKILVQSGSDHIKSHIDPSWGIYCFLSIDLIYIMLQLLHLLNHWCLDSNLHERRKYFHQLWQPRKDSQKHQYNISKHLMIHISSNIHHKIRIFELFVYINDFLWSK